MEHDYTFLRSFKFDKNDGKTLLCCDGLDTLCELYVNDCLVGRMSILTVNIAEA